MLNNNKWKKNILSKNPIQKQKIKTPKSLTIQICNSFNPYYKNNLRSDFY